MKNLFAIRANAGWKVGTLDNDYIGWSKADFVFSIDGGQVTILKDRASGYVGVTFLTIEMFLSYIEDYYNSCATNVNVHKVCYFKISGNGFHEREIALNKHIASKNRSVYSK